MRRLVWVFITLFLISCAGDSDSFTLSGDAQGFTDNTKVYVYAIYGDNRPVILDTLNILSGKFEGTYAKSDKPSLNYLSVEGTKTNVIYFPENTDLKVTVYKDSVDASYVSGSPKNEAYHSFEKEIAVYTAQKQEQVQRFQQARREQDNLLAQQIQQENLALINKEINYKKSFITDNTDSFFSLMLLNEMVSRKEISGAEARQLVKNLPPKLDQTVIARDLKETIANLSKAEVGSLAPDFSAPTPEGKNLSLKDAMGKYTIIDFWASWCKPCRRENPNVVSVYNKYHDQGLNIISVSLDRNGQRQRWLQAIEDDNMDWYHVSNLKFWQDPIAKQYNVKAIPATFLLDENGTIIAKNLRGQALHTKMAELFPNP